MCAMIPMLRRFTADDTSEVPAEEVEGRRPGDLAVGGQRRQHFRDLHRAEPTRLGMISYAVFCLTKKTLSLSVQPMGGQGCVGRADLRLLGPVIPRSKVIGVGRISAEHAKEMGNEAP